MMFRRAINRVVQNIVYDSKVSKVEDKHDTEFYISESKERSVEEHVREMKYDEFVLNGTKKFFRNEVLDSEEKNYYLKPIMDYLLSSNGIDSNINGCLGDIDCLFLEEEQKNLYDEINNGNTLIDHCFYILTKTSRLINNAETSRSLISSRSAFNPKSEKTIVDALASIEGEDCLFNLFIDSNKKFCYFLGSKIKSYYSKDGSLDKVALVKVADTTHEYLERENENLNHKEYKFEDSSFDYNKEVNIVEYDQLHGNVTSINYAPNIERKKEAISNSISNSASDSQHLSTKKYSIGDRDMNAHTICFKYSYNDLLKLHNGDVQKTRFFIQYIVKDNIRPQVKIVGDMSSIKDLKLCKHLSNYTFESKKLDDTFKCSKKNYNVKKYLDNQDMNKIMVNPSEWD